ncbi:BrnA antitoxin family protein [Paramesorhizobium deserti]|nr:BrnA antitoxin family protein [Paramesorhizobium deserti]
MRAIIAAGGVHQDNDGWWVDDTTGELIGPDPEIERPRIEVELKRARPFREAHPDFAASIDRARKARGRPRVEAPKEAVTLRLDPEMLKRFKVAGKNWRTKMAEILDHAKL